MSDANRPPDDQEPTRLSESELPDAGAQQSKASSAKRLGDFELIREIGRGGMGVVYEARQVSLKRRVALKVLPPAIGLTQQARQRFEREAQAAAKLHHTNIVPVHAIGEEDGHHFYAMDLIEGQSLDRVLLEMVDEGSNPLLAQTVTRAASELPRKLAAPSAARPATARAGDATTSLGDTSAGSRPWFDTVAKLIAEVADALDYAHGRGVIHRDIKPANLMLSRDGKLCITDFGLARIAQEPGMTVSGSFLGTPAYMSPEQIAAGRVKLDHRTDVYSLGAVLYELLTLQRPFAGESREEVLSAIMAKDPSSPRKLNGKIPLDLETICLKAMEKDPDRRYATAGEFAQDLRQHMHGGLIAARRAGPLRRFGKSVRRHPVVATIVVAAVLLAGIGSLTVRLGRQKETADALRAVAETRNLIHAGRYFDALRQAQAAYREHPEMAELRLLRGYALIQLGRLREAVAQARRRLDSDPDDWVAHTTLLHAALKGEFLDAEKLNVPIEEHLRAVETLAPESAHVYFLRALSAELDAAESFSLLNKALELDPGHADALVVRINRLVHQGDFEAALLDCERLTAVRPRSSQGRRLKAYTYRRQLELESALATINQAVDLEPEMPSNYHQRAAVYQLMGRTEEAFEDRTRTVEMASRIGWHYQNRSWLYETMGRGDDAIVDAETAHEADPHNLGNYPRLLDLYRRFGRELEYQAALESLERLPESLVRPKTRARAHRIRGYHGHERDGRLEQALAAYSQAIEADSRQPEAYLLRGRLLLKMGRAEEALADYDKALVVEAGCERPYRARGWALRWLGRPEEALSDFSEAIDARFPGGGDEGNQGGEFLLVSGVLTFPVYEETYLNRARLLLALGRIDEAFADYDSAADVRPRSQAPSLYRGLALLHRGRLEGSLVEMNRAVSLGFDGGLPAIEEGGGNAWAHWGRAQASVFQPGSCDQVEADLDRALELGRADPAIWTAVARTRAAFVHRLCPEIYDGAHTFDLARRAVNDNRSAVERYGALGLVQYQSGQYEAARDSMERALVLRGEELLPDELPMAMILWKLGERETARDSYRRAVEAWPYPEDPGYELFREEAAELLGIQP